MKVSVNGLKQYAGIALPVDRLVEKIGAQLGGIDEVVELGGKYQGIIVAKVGACQKHGNADKLSVCKIDDGGVAQDVQRDENGHVQVVCGAPNVRQGMLAAWLPPGTTVPASLGKDPLMLEAREIRGLQSNGMLASLKELALGDDHSGILEIPEGDAKPGDDFAQTFGLDDYIIDIENKMFTHRPDLFGVLGVAREVAGIQHQAFKSPDWYVENPNIPPLETDELKLEVKNELPELVPRFTAITLGGVRVGPSPLWLQIYLAKMGQKSINNIVDYTNFFMLETGQPLHAYDYDKVKDRSEGGATIVVRHPEKDEKITLLNGKEIEPRAEAVMIATDKQAVGIGGVMGGAETEVDTETTNIILECASFDMYSIRRTAMQHGLFTDAVTRFTKGQSPLQNEAVLAKIADEIRTHAGGKVASHLIDVKNEKVTANNPQLGVSASFVNDRLGLGLSAEEMAGLLQNVEFNVAIREQSLAITPPFWRTDIEIPEDIVEEVGRLYGYDRLPLELPSHSIVPQGPDALLRLKRTLRHSLASMGANETLTYSFVHGDLLEKSGQSKDDAYKINNALSPGLQYYRLSLTPSLLSHVHHNAKAGFDRFALFELGKTHSKKNELTDGVPKETDTLSLVTVGSAAGSAAGSPFYQARAYLDQLAQKLGVELVYYPAERDPGLAMTAPFELTRSAFVTVKDSKGMLGIVGEYKKLVTKKLKLPRHSSGFEVGVKELLEQSANAAGPAYKPLSRYPGTQQDICVQVAPTTAYKQVHETVQEALAGLTLETGLMPIDIYQPDSAQYKNITLRVSLADTAKTITAADAKAAVEKVSRLLESRLKARIV